MKANALLVWVLAICGWVPVQAQNVVIAAGVTVTPTAVQTSVEAPAAVACAPAGCYRARPCVAPIVYPAPYPYSYTAYTPNVIYFGGPYSHVRNYYSGHSIYGSPYSPIVYFGRREALERGYYFHWRR